MLFTTKKVNTQTLGEYLAVCRARVHMSVAEAAKFSQVQPKFVAALEAGRYKDLPAAVYVRGFLRSLARSYGVSEQLLLEQFGAESQISENLQKLQEAEQPSKFTLPRFVLSPRTLIILGAVALAILSLGYLYFQVSSLNRAPRLDVLSPGKDSTVSDSALVVSGRTDPDANVYLNNQQIVADANGEFHEDLSLGPGSNLLTIKAVNKFGKETTLTRSVLLQEKAIAGSFTSSSTPAQIQGLRLEVAVGPQSAWVHIEADGVEKFSGTMLPNSQQLITANDKIVLTTGNAGSTHLYFGGKDLGLVGKEGETVQDIEFTK